MKFNRIHICCVIVAILVLFFLYNRISMYEGDKPMTCTCTSASASEPANTAAPAAPTSGGMMPGPATMMPEGEGETEGMTIGN